MHMIPEQSDQDPILQKTRELCAAILQDTRFTESRKRVDSFMADKIAQDQYRELSESGRTLREKQMQGIQLSDQEIDEFEKKRFALLENPVAKAFIEVQNEMNGVQEVINKYINKTFELGRIPQEEDLSCGDESCGSGCGCH